MTNSIDRTVNEKVIYKKFNLYSVVPVNERYDNDAEKFTASYTIIVPTNDKHQQPNISTERIVNAVNKFGDKKNAELKEFLPPLILTSKHDNARYDLTRKYFDILTMLRANIVFADYNNETDTITIKPVTRKIKRRVHSILYKMIAKSDYEESDGAINNFIKRV